MPSKIHAAKCASHGSIAFVLQKLGIPTEIGTSWLAYYDNPIDAMAEGDSVHIMPGVDRKDYGATPRHCTRSQRDNSNCGFLQLTRGKSKSMTIERSSPQARDYRACEHTHSRLPSGLERFCEHVVCNSARSRLAGSLGAPLRTGFYVQQRVVDRLYATCALHKPFP